jgi:hypothetical protein
VGNPPRGRSGGSRSGEEGQLGEAIVEILAL